MPGRVFFLWSFTVPWRFQTVTRNRQTCQREVSTAAAHRYQLRRAQSDKHNIKQWILLRQPWETGAVGVYPLRLHSATIVVRGLRPCCRSLEPHAVTRPRKKTIKCDTVGAVFSTRGTFERWLDVATDMMQVRLAGCFASCNALDASSHDVAESNQYCNSENSWRSPDPWRRKPQAAGMNRALDIYCNAAGWKGFPLFDPQGCVAFV